MKFKTFLGAVSAIALTAAAPAVAQDTNTSTSGSGAEANSGSISGSESNGNQQGQSQNNIGGNNAGIGSSTSESTSGSNAASGSESYSGANSNQGQTQGQATSQTNSQGQMATNQQGTTVSNTFNSTQRKRTYNGTNTAVPLAASSSFSSDYCGGTASGGASIAPIGVSIGGAAPTFDTTCQYLRLSEKGGMMAANWHNMGVFDMRNRTMAFATWAMCMAGPQADKRRKGNSENVAMQACLTLGLLGSETSPMSAPPVPAPEPQVQDSSGYPTPEAVERLKTPRGDLEFYSNPVIQEAPAAVAAR